MKTLFYFLVLVQLEDVYIMDLQNVSSTSNACMVPSVRNRIHISSEMLQFC